MIKKINIAKGQAIEINSSTGWIYTYQEQFGHDVLAILMPALEASLKAAGHVAQGLNPTSDEFRAQEILAALDDDTIGELFISLSGLELTTMYNMIWALAKNADESIPEPKTWFNSFDNFYIDEVVPKCLGEIIRSSASKKNLEKLTTTIKKAMSQSQSNDSQSEPSTED